MRDIKFAGRFLIEAIRPDGSKRVLCDWFENLIVNQGLDQIGSENAAVTHVFVGSGNTPPAATNVAMQSLVASSGNKTGSTFGTTTSPPYYGYQRATWRFLAGEAAGNLAEIGVGWAPSSDALFSRALIKNSVGDPTTITVLSDEVLDVTYELRLYVPVADVTFQAEIAGVTHDCVLRAAVVTEPSAWSAGRAFGIPWSANALAFNGDIADVTARPSGESALGVLTFDPYTPEDFFIQYRINFDLNDANFVDGIKSVCLETPFAGSYQWSFDPPILKDATRVLELVGKISWARSAS